MKYIELTKGYTAIVDDEDYERINAMSWHVQIKTKTQYAIGSTYANGIQYTRRMHRVIMNVTKNQQVDHKNGNGLDNRKENLRICDAKQNARNRKKVGKSLYKGVKLEYTTKTGKEFWIARISKNRVVEYLGHFDNPIDAAKAYDLEAIKRFGDFAKLNFGKEIYK